jgi:hypothetical protein
MKLTSVMAIAAVFYTISSSSLMAQVPQSDRVAPTATPSGTEMKSTSDTPNLKSGEEPVAPNRNDRPANASTNPPSVHAGERLVTGQGTAQTPSISEPSTK